MRRFHPHPCNFRIRFHCHLCDCHGELEGPPAGPHSIVRTVRAATRPTGALLWRYEIRKHEQSAWMEMDHTGYVADSAGTGFGPLWLQAAP